MKVLITGANGQLGYELNMLLGKSAILTDAAELDITNLTKVLKAPEADLIINCAAYTNVDGAEDDYEAAYAVNVIGPKNLTQLAKERNIPIIHVSTDYVFDGTADTPYLETDRTNPKSVYGKTKLEGEEWVRQYEKHYIVRTAWLYGINGKNFVKTIARAGRERGALKVVEDQIGCPTNAHDLAQQLLRLAETENYGTYHCTGSGRCSWYDFACEIIAYLKIPCTVTPCKTGEFPAKAERPAFSVLSNEKIEKTVKNAMPDWKCSLHRFLDENKLEG